MDALTTEERARRAELFTRLSAAVNQIQELPNGFSLTVSPVPNIWMIAAEFITLESRCCPFLSFSCKLKQKTAQCRCGLPAGRESKSFLQPNSTSREELEAGKPVFPPVPGGNTLALTFPCATGLSKAGPGRAIFEAGFGQGRLTRGAQAARREAGYAEIACSFGKVLPSFAWSGSES